MKRRTDALAPAFTLLVSAYLVYRLTRLGWAKVWGAIPLSPVFYLALLAKFLALPASHALAFGEIWGLPFRKAFPVSLIKRTLDKNVLDLSGDVYLFAWCRRNLAASPKDALLAIKDNLLMSTAASAAASVVLLAVFLGAGVVVLAPGRPAGVWRWAALAAAAAVIGVLAFRFRKRILFLAPRALTRLFLLHLGRVFLVQALQIVQWVAAMPDVPLSKWLNLLAAQIVIGFIPVMPSRNLVFFGAGLELSRRLAIDTPELAGTLLAANVVVQAVNLGLFLWASLAVKKTGGSDGAPPAVTGTGDGDAAGAASASFPTGSAGPDREGPAG